MGEVVILGGVTTLDIPAERVLNGGLEADLKDAVLIGRDQNGELYFAGTTSDAAKIVWLMEVAKIELLKLAKVI